eukprot:COSAG02_NODE_1714_length_11220_cov_3.198543_10_plen_116_part_00
MLASAVPKASPTIANTPACDCIERHRFPTSVRRRAAGKSIITAKSRLPCACRGHRRSSEGEVGYLARIFVYGYTTMLYILVSCSRLRYWYYSNSVHEQFISIHTVDLLDLASVVQ